MHKILIVDDDVAVTNYLMVFLMQTELYETTVMNESGDVPDLLSREDFDVILLDMDMPVISGFDILKLVKGKGVDTPVVILTGVADVDLAVDSMKLGAFDYLTKPVDDDHLLEVIGNAIKHSSMHDSIEKLPMELTTKGLNHADAFDHLPTQDPQMIRVFHQAEKMANCDLSIFIWGENGTWKRLLAESIHKTSPRADGPFFSVNASAEDPALFPSLFFGQAKDWSGAKEDRPGLIEEAAGGTLFLDEIDSLTMPMQVRLRRVIQQGESYREGSTRVQEIDVRFIVSSNHDLTSEEYSESFLQDLLYLLMINSLELPPLRERAGDIPLVARYFLNQESEKAGKKITDFSDDLINLLKAHSFPNNLRELRHIVTTMVINEDESIIGIPSLTPYIRDLLTRKGKVKPAVFKPRKLSDVEYEHVLKMLEFYNDDKEKAAEKLGISIDEIKKILNKGE
jgi:DNA-binding NtrC family response regulator